MSLVKHVQKTFSELEYTGKKKQTRRDRFLADLEQLVPWAELESQVIPFYSDTTGKRDPEMHQAKKGNQWHFRMKAHIGVDATTGLVRSLVGTAANLVDITLVDQLLHGVERH